MIRTKFPGTELAAILSVGVACAVTGGPLFGQTPGPAAIVSTRENAGEPVTYVITESGAHGTAGSVLYDGDAGVISIENGEFSRCEAPDTDFWLLRAESITIDLNSNQGYARKVSLRIGDVPVFYFPFTLPFPVGDEPVSGFLAPSIGTTRDGGLDIEIPYYLRLAPHYDATLSPRRISDRGFMANVELRYLASWSMNTLNLSSLGGDDLFDPASKDIPGTESPPVADRWFLGYEHQGTLGRNWSTYVDYNAVSDSDYFIDLGGSSLNVASQTHLNRQGRLDFTSPYLRAGLNVQRIQIIDPFVADLGINKPFDRLPEFHFDSDVNLNGGFRLGVSGQITSFDRSLNAAEFSNEQVENGVFVDGERINLEPFLSWSAESSGWFVRATGKYKYVGYNLDNQAGISPAKPDIEVPVASLDGGLVFERDRPGGGKQTLEPRIFYLFSDFEDQSTLPLFDTSEMNFSFQQLFRDDRFAGGDRIGDADQITLAVTSRLLDRAGSERARFSIGQIFHFEDRRVTLSNPLQAVPSRQPLKANQSALTGEVVLKLGENWWLGSDLQWNDAERRTDEGSFQLRYYRDNDHLFNLSFRYKRLTDSPNLITPPGVDPRVKQTDLSGIWPLNNNWKALGRWNYDFSNSRNLEFFAGVEWSNCCAALRLIGREWVDENELFVPGVNSNRGIFIQLTLKGLGNLTGGGLGSLLQDGIRGFREPDYGL